MRTMYSLGVLASLLCVTGEAMPCGGAFGTSITIKPAQKIIVGYRDGVETYIFNPEFCGKADSFGLILPVPSTLTAQPKLGTQKLYTDLAAVAAPTIVTQDQCPTRGTGASRPNGVGGSAGYTSDGTTVVQRGQVGIFDWALLKATDVSSFTEWLDTNQYPRDAGATSAFQSYVDKGWYFVAFKVSAGGASGTAGASGVATSVAANTTICGSFGPVSLSFAVNTNPVIPARIASVSSSSLSWDIFAIGSTQMRMQGANPTLYFSGEIAAADLASHPALEQVARAGDRLTEFMLSMTPQSDLILEPNPEQADYRREVTQIRYLDYCTGGTSGGGSSNRGGTSARPIAGGAGGAGGTATTGKGNGGAGEGGAARGGATTGPATATGGAATSAPTASGGNGSRGGSSGIGGGTSSKKGSATTVGTTLGGAAATEQNQEENGWGCSIPAHRVGPAPRGFLFVGLLGTMATLLRRRRKARGR